MNIYAGVGMEIITMVKIIDYGKKSEWGDTYSRIRNTTVLSVSWSCNRGGGDTTYYLLLDDMIFSIYLNCTVINKSIHWLLHVVSRKNSWNLPFSIAVIEVSIWWTSRNEERVGRFSNAFSRQWRANPTSHPSSVPSLQCSSSLKKKK